MINYLIFFGLLISSLIIFFIHKVKYQTQPINEEFDKCESPIERRLYRALQHNGYRLETQVHCGPYRIDIVLSAFNIAIECDGKPFHSSVEQKAHDRKKNTYLRKNGWKVMRFSGRQINRNISNVITRIENEIQRK
ncbi:endonuclease domain-containing protein [Pseudalkalibacillus sp. NRS-1564]|uniref:endonuclease domain-containing protein n=1 Tax=Pseudalkalibacillus sp. NRS-1564 TaxID=3233900 RepID=UPI003D2E8EFB